MSKGTRYLLAESQYDSRQASASSGPALLSSAGRWDGCQRRRAHIKQTAASWRSDVGRLREMMPDRGRTSPVGEPLGFFSPNSSSGVGKTSMACQGVCGDEEHYIKLAADSSSEQSQGSQHPLIPQLTHCLYVLHVDVGCRCHLADPGGKLGPCDVICHGAQKKRGARSAAGRLTVGEEHGWTTAFQQSNCTARIVDHRHGKSRSCDQVPSSPQRQINPATKTGQPFNFW